MIRFFLDRRFDEQQGSSHEWKSINSMEHQYQPIVLQGDDPHRNAAAAKAPEDT